MLRIGRNSFAAVSIEALLRSFALFVAVLVLSMQLNQLLKKPALQMLCLHIVNPLTTYPIKAAVVF